MECLLNYLLKCFGKIHLSELFPNKASGLIFLAYMALFVNQGLLVTASQKSDSSYHYNTIMAVLATELVKLTLSFHLYIKDHNVLSFCQDVKTHRKVLCHYFVPAFLYTLYNNLAFVNLSAFDPTTYFLLLQLRVVITGVLFQVVFSKKLSVKQWLSLLMLTAGCMIKQLPFSGPALEVSPSAADSDVTIKALDKGVAPLLSWNMLFILIQVFCSCLAGVYNELLLKRTDMDQCHIFLQNVFMYFDSILCNVVLLIWQGEIQLLWDLSVISPLFDYKVILVIFNNAAIGIVTSLFLRSLNSILKTFASALELIFTAILAWLLFNIPIYLNTICAIFVVSLAVILYSQNPVSNTRPKEVSPV